MNNILRLCALLGLALVANVAAHSYVTKPTARSPMSSCRIGGPPEFPVNCPGPCDAAYNTRQAITNVKRGDPLQVDWPRNNHPGGFIRLSWISDTTPEHTRTLIKQQASIHVTKPLANLTMDLALIMEILMALMEPRILAL
jgi:hypothetical protein